MAMVVRTRNIRLAMLYSWINGRSCMHVDFRSKRRSQKDNMDMIGWRRLRQITSTPMFAELQSSDSRFGLAPSHVEAKKPARRIRCLWVFGEFTVSDFHASRITFVFRGKRIDETKLKRNNLHMYMWISFFVLSFSVPTFGKTLVHVCHDVDGFFTTRSFTDRTSFSILFGSQKENRRLVFSHIFF